MPAPIQFSFKDRTTGAPVATAIIPEGYLVNATITDKNANDLVPLHAYIAALSPDQSILLNSNSKGMWEQLINPLMQQTAKMTGVRKSNFAPYPDPDRYLLEYAAAFMDGKKAALVATATLPGSFADNRQAIHDNFIQEFIAPWSRIFNKELIDKMLLTFTVLFPEKNLGKTYSCLISCILQHNFI